MNLTYLVFLFPFLFGWELWRRLDKKERKTITTGELFVRLFYISVMAVATPLIWFWFEPPDYDTHPLLLVTGGLFSIMLIVIGACICGISNALRKKGSHSVV